MYIKIDSNNLIIEIYADKHDGLLFVDWSTTNNIMDERGIYRYKLVDGKPVERTQEEMDADYAARPAPEPTDTELLLETAADHEYRLCLMELGVSEDDL